MRIGYVHEKLEKDTVFVKRIFTTARITTTW